jgi:uncharacterized repeat protein (TIGR01451 family)/CSLREA domain-containing protein
MRKFRNVNGQRVLIALVVAIAIIGFMPRRALAATWVVNSLTDSHDANTGDTVCSDAAGFCTLRAAIEQAASGDTITIPLGGILLLDPATMGGGLVINKNLAINGPGVSALTISGQNLATVISVNAGNSLQLSGVTLGNGLGAFTGGLANAGITTLTSVTVSGNRDTSVAGPTPTATAGGIHNSNGAVLSLTNSVVSGNTSAAGAGGIYNAGSLTLNGSLVNSNQGFLAGGLVAEDSSLAPGANFSATNSIFNNNTGSGAGAISNAQSALITNTTISGNIASGLMFGAAGGIVNSNIGNLVLTTSTLSTNTASSATGNIAGGILNQQSGVITLGNATLSDNSGAGTGGGTNSVGGIFNANQASLTNVTVANNSGSVSSMFNTGGALTVKNTIFASSSLANCNAAITNGNNNLQFPDTTCGPSFISGNPNLGPLQNNGGPTQTRDLLAGSLALETADTATCAGAPVSNLDQRGFNRPNPSATQCDMGAVESPQRQSPAVQTATQGAILTATQNFLAPTQTQISLLLTSTQIVANVTATASFLAPTQTQAAASTGTAIIEGPTQTQAVIDATATQVAANATATASFLAPTQTQAALDLTATRSSSDATGTAIIAGPTQTQAVINATGTAIIAGPTQTQAVIDATQTAIVAGPTQTQAAVNATGTQSVINATATSVALSATPTITPSPTLTVTPAVSMIGSLSVNNSAPLEGDQVIFTLSITNQGPSQVNNVQASLQVGLDLFSNLPASPSILGAGQSATVTFPAHIVTATDTCNLSPVVSASGTSAFGSVSVQSIAMPFINVQRAKLTVGQIGGPSPVTIGQTGTFTVSVTNAGCLPITLTSMTTSTPTAKAGGLAHPARVSPVTMNINPIPAGQTATATVTHTFTSTDPNPFRLQFSFIGTATTATGTTLTVSATTATAAITVQQPGASGGTGGTGGTSGSAQGTSLTITKQASTGTSTEGGTVSFTITVANPTGATIQGISVTDSLPAGLNVVSAISTVGTAVTNGSVITAAIGQLTSGQTASITINVTVGTGTSGQVLNNTACATFGGGSAPLCANASVSVGAAGASVLPATGSMGTPKPDDLLLLLSAVVIFTLGASFGLRRFSR